MFDLITANNISKSYSGTQILHDVNFSALDGESAVIIGRNGSGKSTLLSILAGYLKPDAGTVATHGANPAFCPQHDNLFDELTVRDNLLFWAKASGGAHQNVSNLSELLGADSYAHKRISELSGGMKKSVAILCAMTNNSPTLILDEPFAGLDIFYKNTLLKALDHLKGLGKCIIYTSHNTDEIAGLESKIYTLANAKLTYAGMREDLFEQNIHANSLENLLQKLT